MTVKELRKTLKHLDPDREVKMEVKDDQSGYYFYYTIEVVALKDEDRPVVIMRE